MSLKEQSENSKRLCGLPDLSGSRRWSPIFFTATRAMPFLLLLILSGSLSAQFNNGLSLASDPISAHGYHTLSNINPAYAAAFRDGAVFISGQNIASVIDSLTNNSFELGMRQTVGSFKGAISANINYVFVPLVARYISGNFGFAYPIVDENDHRLMLGASLGIGNREILDFRRSGLPSSLDRRNRIYPDLGAGLWYTYRELSLGAGATHIGRPTVEYTPAVTATIDDLYYISARYDADWAGITVSPSFLGRYASSANFVSDFLLDGRFEDQFGLGVGYRVDLRRKIPPNPSIPVADQRFRQLLLTAEVGFQERFNLLGTYSFVINQFTANRSNFELTLLYQFKQPPVIDDYESN